MGYLDGLPVLNGGVIGVALHALLALSVMDRTYEIP